MCGLITAYSRNAKKSASITVVKQYGKQWIRGNDGFGFIAVDLKNGHKIEKYIRKQTEQAIEKQLLKCESNLIMYHHRLPTSTINIPETNHPIKISHPDLPFILYVAHNGIISNADDRQIDHKVNGYNYSTAITVCEKVIHANQTYTISGSKKEKFNDSEALAWDIALVLAGKQKEVKARGSIAFTAIQTDLNGKVTHFHYGRNAFNPLILQTNKNGWLLASEANGKMIDPDVLYTIDLISGKNNQQKLILPTNPPISVGFNYDYGNWGNWGKKSKKKDKKSKIAKLEDQVNQMYDNEDRLRLTGRDDIADRIAKQREQKEVKLIDLQIALDSDS